MKRIQILLYIIAILLIYEFFDGWALFVTLGLLFITWYAYEDEEEA